MGNNTPDESLQDSVSNVSSQRLLSKHSSSSLPLLSVVAYALEDKGDSRSKNSYSESSEDESEILASSSDDDDSLGYASDDEEDPILSMIRQSKPKTKKSKSRTSHQKPKPSSTTKSSKRILEDLDERLATTTDQMESGSTTQPQHPQQQSLPATPSVRTPIKFGSWFKQVASTQVNRILRRPTEQVSKTNNAKPPPPLARQRQPQRQDGTKKPEDDFQVTASSSVLADAELAELAKLKTSGGIQWSTLLYENRQFVFIAFTLALSAFMYFFTRKSWEDDVT